MKVQWMLVDCDDEDNYIKIDSPFEIVDGVKVFFGPGSELTGDEAVFLFGGIGSPKSYPGIDK
jgi:hypothetical protein